MFASVSSGLWIGVFAPSSPSSRGVGGKGAFSLSGMVVNGTAVATFCDPGKYSHCTWYATPSLACQQKTPSSKELNNLFNFKWRDSYVNIERKGGGGALKLRRSARVRLRACFMLLFYWSWLVMTELKYWSSQVIKNLRKSSQVSISVRQSLVNSGAIQHGKPPVQLSHK